MRVSFAVWEPVSRIDDGARDTRYNAALLHRAVSSASDLYNWWQTDPSPGVGAHFYVNQQGILYQYLDTDRKTGHAWNANGFSVGIETWDGTGLAPAWNDAQIATIVRLLKELNIPAQLIASPYPGDGVGWHEKFWPAGDSRNSGYPSWNESNHACPGSVRESQIRDVILPKLADQGGDFLMALTDLEQQEVLKNSRDVHNFLHDLATDLGVKPDVQGWLKALADALAAKLP